MAHKLFVDTSIFLAFIDRAHPNHLRANHLLENIASAKNYQLFTSLTNITETATVLTYDMGISLALDFVSTLLESDVEIVYPSRADLVTAHKIMKSNRDRAITPKEALNATLMQRRDVTYTLTFGSWNNLFGTHISNLSA